MLRTSAFCGYLFCLAGPLSTCRNTLQTADQEAIIALFERGYSHLPVAEASPAFAVFLAFLFHQALLFSYLARPDFITSLRFIQPFRTFTRTVTSAAIDSLEAGVTTNGSVAFAAAFFYLFGPFSFGLREFMSLH